MLAKIAGANLVLLIVATATVIDVQGGALARLGDVWLVIAAVVVALVINTTLVILAVRPLHVIESTVDRIWQGDFSARVPVSRLADRDAARMARTFNMLLDSIVADRERLRRLAAEVIGAADAERAAISRELHDSVAQEVAALVMQLSVIVRSAETAPRDQLQQAAEEVRKAATSSLEEIRMLAHTMHPRVLDDLGLVAALRRLARETLRIGSGDVEVIADDIDETNLPASVKSVLYRVAQEAVQNARRHARAHRIVITLETADDLVTLQVRDDGPGFDVEVALAAATGIGLVSMQERVAIVNGSLRITSAPGMGTLVTAAVPLHAEDRSLTDGAGG